MERHEGVPAAFDRLGQEAGAATQRHKAILPAGAAGPAAFDHTVTIVINKHEAAARQEQGQQNEHAKGQVSPKRDGQQDGEHEGFRDRPTMGLDGRLWGGLAVKQSIRNIAGPGRLHGPGA